MIAGLLVLARWCGCSSVKRLRVVDVNKAQGVPDKEPYAKAWVSYCKWTSLKIDVGVVEVMGLNTCACCRGL